MSLVACQISTYAYPPGWSHNPEVGAIKKLAQALEASEDELLLLAQKVPDSIRQRVIQRPDAFRKVASLDDETLNRLLKDLDE